MIPVLASAPGPTQALVRGDDHAAGGLPGHHAPGAAPPALLTDGGKLASADLQGIATKLQALLGQLPIPQQKALRTQLSKGLTKQEAVQVLLAPR